MRVIFITAIVLSTDTIRNVISRKHITSTPCPEKRGHVIFNYNSRISWSIFIIFIPLETGMNTAQLHVIYLLKIFMTS